MADDATQQIPKAMLLGLTSCVNVEGPMVVIVTYLPASRSYTPGRWPRLLGVRPGSRVVFRTEDEGRRKKFGWKERKFKQRQDKRKTGGVLKHDPSWAALKRRA